MDKVLGFKHLAREFRSKVFLISVVNRGQSIKVLERNRIADYHVTFDLGTAAWLCDFIKGVVNLGGKENLVRKFRGSSYVLLVEVRSNRRGSFLEVSRLQNGTVGSIIVPEDRVEKKCRGWLIFLKELESILGRDRTVSDVDTSKELGKEGPGYGERLHGGEIRRSASSHAGNKWSLAVVVYRNNLETRWSTINIGLSRKLRREVTVTELFADRAILWCVSDLEKRLLLKFERYYLFNTSPVKVMNWCHEHHWVNVKFEGRDRWVGAEGLPLDWWNRFAFRDTGDKLGGLTEVDTTSDLSFLRFARLTVRGFKTGFLPSEIELPWGSSRLRLRIFPIDVTQVPVSAAVNGKNSSVAKGEGTERLNQEHSYWRRSEWRRVEPRPLMSDVATSVFPNKPANNPALEICDQEISVQHGQSEKSREQETFSKNEDLMGRDL